jgi:hypothetical protein
LLGFAKPFSEALVALIQAKSGHVLHLRLPENSKRINSSVQITGEVKSSRTLWPTSVLGHPGRRLLPNRVNYVELLYQRHDKNSDMAKKLAAFTGIDLLCLYVHILNIISKLPKYNYVI